MLRTLPLMAIRSGAGVHGDLEVEEVNEAIRVLEEADYQANAEEERDYINTRATVNQERFQTEHEADRYAEYVAMGWREPEPQDIGKVVFNRSHRRTEANLIRARATLREAYLSRHAGEVAAVEQANIYFDQALKSRPKEAWEALWKEILKGNSKSIWHGKHREDLTPEQRKLVLGFLYRSADSRGSFLPTRASGLPLDLLAV